MGGIRVLVVDESREFIAWLQAWFKDDPLIEVVAAACADRGVLAEIERERPDLVLLDVRLKPAGGFEAVRRIKSLQPAPAVVLMSFLSSEAARQAATAAGAERLLAKSAVVRALPPLAREMLERRGCDSAV